MKISNLFHIKFYLLTLHERLWFKPLIAAALSILAIFLANLADHTPLGQIAPDISTDTIDKLLTIMASSMLVIATFAVGSMVSAYNAAATSATPRSFRMVVADDTSQFALSTFIGAFIFSIVALVYTQLNYFDRAGRFVVFALILLVFAIVILTFIKWVHNIAHLGRMSSVIERVEQETAKVLAQRREQPTMGAMPANDEPFEHVIRSRSVGYIQDLDVAALQAWAEAANTQVRVAALPGTFVTLGGPLLYIKHDTGWQNTLDEKKLHDAFQRGSERTIYNDPRHGLIVLSEIASRALSPAVNDPGTAIAVTCSLVNLLTQWRKPALDETAQAPRYNRVQIPVLSVMDLFEDAFLGISRDGAGLVEVMIRLQKGLEALATIGDDEMTKAARHHARLAFKRATQAITFEEDLAAIRRAADFAL